MIFDQTEFIWLDEHHAVSLQELIGLTSLSPAELHRLVESGALMPSSSNASDVSSWQFSSHCLVSLRTLSRLKQDFELEPNALGLMLVFLEKIRALEFQLQQLKQTNPD